MEVVLSRAKHNHTIINLHGRGSNATEYKDDFHESETSDHRTLIDVFPGIKWLYPTADIIPSRRFGSEMSQWFDMWETDEPQNRADEQARDLNLSVARIKQVILDEGKLVGLENVVLCGISQGAATAVTALLGLDRRLGGFIGFATWATMPVMQKVPGQAVLTTPVFLAHNRDDNVIDVKHGEALKGRLEELGMPVTWRTYATGGHWINEPACIDDLVGFLESVVDPKG